MYELIHSLEGLKREKAALIEAESILTRPLITDIDRMDEVYSAFRTVSNARNTFIIIAVRLVSPKALAGNHLGAGVRNKMASVLGCEPTVVSHAFENLVFHYKKYRSFRKEVDQTFAFICKKLNIS